MLTVLALAMIVAFIVLLSMKKLSVFNALTLVPIAFGVLALFVGGNSLMNLFTWIKEGVFFSVDWEAQKVSWGVISPGLTILFSILFFDIMLGAGLFDPVAIFFIRMAKGDPLKVLLSTVMVATVVSFNGDTTTTIIICIAGFLNLYKQLGLKLSYLAIIIVAPIGIWNQLPWGGPTIAAATAQGIEVNELFAALLPGLLAAEVAVIAITYLLGKKERRRLGYTGSNAEIVSVEYIEQMIAAVRDKDIELKRPSLFWFNVVLTLASISLLIQGEIHGSIIFMLASAIALMVNYPSVKDSSARLEDLAPDVLPTAVITLGAGVFTGILTGSGMAAALASFIAQAIPVQLAAHMAPVYAVIATPAVCFLPQDAFYFGIASVMKDVMAQFGISATQAAVASMIGQSFRLVSPVIPALYLLCESCGLNFVDFQKTYAKYYGIVLLAVYLVAYGAVGSLPY